MVAGNGQGRKGREKEIRKNRGKRKTKWKDINSQDLTLMKKLIELKFNYIFFKLYF